MRPPVTIVMTTWLPEDARGDIRIAAVQRAIGSWLEYIKYDGELLLHVADDGSKHGDYGTCVETLPCTWWPGNVSFSRQESHGVGASLNAGFRHAFKLSPFVIYLADDWELLRPFDLRQWVDLLLLREDLGMVNFGPPNCSIVGEMQWIRKRTDQWLSMTYDAVNHAYFLMFHRSPPIGKSIGYVFAHRPALYHKRFTDRWGWFKEDTGAQDCERDYNKRWLAGKENDIVMAFYETWRHIPGTEFALHNPQARRRAEGRA